MDYNNTISTNHEALPQPYETVLNMPLLSALNGKNRFIVEQQFLAVI
ncbi:MAG: hypothetical protein IAF58_20420 [Leptolyngbya sp.]|nr:hypothetical protein [Candidatus Melainabacteria bacterium]